MRICFMSELSIIQSASISKDYDSFACLLDTGKCVEVLREIRWPGGLITCPNCESPHTKYLSSYKEHYNRWLCDGCGKTFNEKTNTIFSESKLPITKWFYAISLMRNKSSDINLADELHVDRKTGRRVGSLVRGSIFYQRIREKLGKEVEADEVYITAGSKGNNSSRPKNRDPRVRGFKKKGVERTTQTNHPF